MRRTSFLVICLFLANMNAIGSQADDNYWQQFVHYTMNVTLEPNKHILSGEETILYKNNSPGTLFKLYMHLYPNAFPLYITEIHFCTERIGMNGCVAR